MFEAGEVISTQLFTSSREREAVRRGLGLHTLECVNDAEGRRSRSTHSPPNHSRSMCQKADQLANHTTLWPETRRVPRLFLCWRSSPFLNTHRHTSAWPIQTIITRSHTVNLYATPGGTGDRFLPNLRSSSESQARCAIVNVPSVGWDPSQARAADLCSLSCHAGFSCVVVISAEWTLKSATFVLV